MNRMIVAFKRILKRKLYIGMLTALIIMTIVYQLLPAKSQSTEILVAVYMEEQDSYTTALRNELDQSASLYHFYYTDSPSELINDVQAGKAECGFVVPENFFADYINGSGIVKIALYETPAGTLSAAISETFFHYIFKTASPQILVDTINDSALDEKLQQKMQEYMNSETIFRMSSTTNGAYDYKENTYRMMLPIQEFTCLLAIFSCLFGLMMFLQDRERGIYIALSANRIRGIQYTTLSASILPVYIIGIICNLIAYGTTTLPFVSLISIGAFAFSIILSLFIKKSQTLAKILPILLLFSILYFFILYIF
mgnify:FL=1